MKYPIAIESGNDKYTYGIMIPDLPGYFTASDSFEEAIINARTALTSYADTLHREGVEPPQASTIEAHNNNPAYKNCYWTYIET